MKAIEVRLSVDPGSLKAQSDAEFLRLWYRDDPVTWELRH